MPFIKVYIHFVWSTKNWKPFLDSPELRKKVWQHIKENAEQKEIFVDMINGYQDHCHCLISLGADQTMSKIMQLLKENHPFGSIRTIFVSKNLNGRTSILRFLFPNQ